MTVTLIQPQCEQLVPDSENPGIRLHTTDHFDWSPDGLHQFLHKRRKVFAALLREKKLIEFVDSDPNRTPIQADEYRSSPNWPIKLSFRKIFGAHFNEWHEDDAPIRAFVRPSSLSVPTGFAMTSDVSEVYGTFSRSFVPKGPRSNAPLPGQMMLINQKLETRNALYWQRAQSCLLTTCDGICHGRMTLDHTNSSDRYREDQFSDDEALFCQDFS
jgi:hypothetical protein